MTRKFKAIGLALVAVFALSAMATSTASAKTNGEFTAAKYPAHITGVAEEGLPSHFFGVGGIEITCDIEEYTGTLAAASTSLEVTPIYGECEANGTRGVTVTHNECKYKFFNASDTKVVEEKTVTTADEWRLTTSLVCPEGKKVEVHIYNETAHNTGTWCTLTMFPADNTNLEGITATVKTNTPTSPNDVTIEGKVTVRNETHNACSAGLTIKTNSTLEVTGVTVTGKDELGGSVSVDIG